MKEKKYNEGKIKNLNVKSSKSAADTINNITNPSAITMQKLKLSNDQIPTLNKNSQIFDAS